MTDRSDLIDTVARAIYVADDPLSRNWCDFRRMARAAIDAMQPICSCPASSMFTGTPGRDCKVHGGGGDD